ncbi:MAG: GEVED domain-containing protein [Crocinitomicaceae bacterium]
MKKLCLLFVLLISSQLYGQRSYKELMQDPSVNFYDVCAAAEAYFETVDKDKKGSGWKGYQRWKAENESKYYPTGQRDNVDPYLPQKSMQRLLGERSGEKTLFPEGWVELGPSNIDSITSHYSTGLGRLETFYVNPDDEDVIYVGTRSGGFWKTTDGGDTWTGGSTDFLVATGVNTIAVSPWNQDSILINVKNSANNITHGIYRSINGGVTWTETDFNPTELGKGGLGSNFQINRVVYHPRVADLIFVCASDGLYRSDDNLDTWLKVTAGSISDIEFHPVDNDIVYIYDYYYWGPNKNKVLYSLDQGLTFSGSAEIVGNSNNTSVQLDVSPICEDCIYFASGNGIWKSFDKGLTFEFASNPSTGSQGFAVSDLDTMNMTYGYVDQFMSADGGYSFDQVTWWGLFTEAAHGPGTYQERYGASERYVHADMREAECINGVFYVATDGHIGRSLDGGDTWEHLTKDMSIRENYTLGASQSNHYRTIVGSQDNGTSIKHKTTWLEYTGGDGMEGIIHPLNDDWMISSYQYGSRTKTFNGGLTLSGASPPDHSSGWVAPMAYDPNDHHIIYHFGENVHKTTDFTQTWEVVGTPSFSGQISEAAIAEINSQIIIASRGQNIERSIDGGVTWTNIKGTLPNFSITDIAFDPNRDSTFVVTYNRWQDDGQKVFITHDLGTTWINITENLNDMPIRGAVIDHSADKNIYLAAEIGVFVKAMDATEWELYNDDLPNCTVNELEVMYGSNALRAATWGRGVWEYSLKDRVDYPSIVRTWITDQPTFVVPAEESEQYVTSLISYDEVILDAYVKWSIDEPTFENTIEMENTEDSTWVSVEPLPDFPAGTKVFFKVYALGFLGQLSETYKFMFEVKPFEYCESYGNMSWETSVTLVDFSDLNNPSGKPAPYTSYVDLDTATVYRSSSYDLTVNLGTDGPYTIHSKAWIDWNRNGSFTDIGEEYDLGTAFDTDDGPTTLSPLSIPVPATANLGKTTMRVSAKYASDPTPCETGFDGEVEDYTIFVKEPIDLDFEISGTDFCEGDDVDFFYTGTELDEISWSFTNGDVSYDFDTFDGTIVAPEAGTYNLILIGWEGPMTDGGTWTSVFTVHPPVETAADTVICRGDEIEFGTQTITEEGVYVEPFATVFGCDSTVTLNASYYDVETGVTADTYVLTADETEATYQWVDCNEDWMIILGAEEQSYEPILNGSYAVIVDDGTCVDTSDCYDIVALSVLENEINHLKVYPNPTSGQFTVELSGVEADAVIRLHDAAGKLIRESIVSNEAIVAFNTDLAPGVYYISLIDSGKLQEIVKLVVEK